MLKNPPESVVFHTEGVVQHGGDIVLPGEVRTEDGCQLHLATTCEQNIKWNTLVGKECECLLTVRPREVKKASGGHSSQEGRCLKEPIIHKRVIVPLSFYDFMRHPVAL